MCAPERDEGKLDRDARKRRCHSVSISRFMPLPKKVSRDLFRSFFLFAFSPPPSKMKIDFFCSLNGRMGIVLCMLRACGESRKVIMRAVCAATCGFSD